MREDTSSSTSESHWAGAWEDRDDAGERMGGGGGGRGGRGEESTITNSPCLLNYT